MKWMCDVCGYAYDGEDFTKEADDYVCPVCDQGKEQFHQRDIDVEVKLAANELIKNKQ